MPTATEKHDKHGDAKLQARNVPTATEKHEEQEKHGDVKLQARNEQPHGPPSWMRTLMEASAAGDKEFRTAARKVIKTGHGPQLQKLLEDMSDKAPEAEKASLKKLASSVKQWIANPEELEEGGRYWVQSYPWNPVYLYNMFPTYYRTYSSVFVRDYNFWWL